ncbi:MAG: hypothetical protein JXA28_08245 [Bacteroidetes bacterium]|nr:hypothetical protein [Bacteroidota bacterium]
MSRSEDIRQLLETSFPLREIAVTIGNHVYRLTTANDIEQLIDRITDEEFRKDERLPYWAELWHSAVALSLYLVEKPSRVRMKRALEIGCGLALPGIVAASAGARITCTDFEEHALLAAELNFRQNLPRYTPDIRYLDFRNIPAERWPVILGADVIYETRFIEPLAHFLATVLEEDGVMYLAEPNRLIAVPFFDALAKDGFHWQRHARETELHGRIVEISVYEISRSRAAIPS